MSLASRRRVLMGQKKNELNGFVDGTYTDFTVSNKNHLVANTANTHNSYLPLIKDIVISTGDVIKIRTTNGKLPSQFGSCGFTNQKSTTSSQMVELTKNKQPPISNSWSTATANKDLTAKYLRIYYGGAGTGECDVEVVINNKRVI